MNTKKDKIFSSLNFNRKIKMALIGIPILAFFFLPFQNATTSNPCILSGTDSEDKVYACMTSVFTQSVWILESLFKDHLAAVKPELPSRILYLKNANKVLGQFQEARFLNGMKFDLNVFEQYKNSQVRDVDYPADLGTINLLDSFAYAEFVKAGYDSPALTASISQVEIKKDSYFYPPKACYVDVDMDCQPLVDTPPQLTSPIWAAHGVSERWALYNSDFVQNSEQGCAQFATLMKTECKLQRPVDYLYRKNLANNKMEWHENIITNFSESLNADPKIKGTPFEKYFNQTPILSCSQRESGGNAVRCASSTKVNQWRYSLLVLQSDGSFQEQPQNNLDSSSISNSIDSILIENLPAGVYKIYADNNSTNLDISDSPRKLSVTCKPTSLDCNVSNILDKNSTGFFWYLNGVEILSCRNNTQCSKAGPVNGINLIQAFKAGNAQTYNGYFKSNIAIVSKNKCWPLPGSTCKNGILTKCPDGIYCDGGVSVPELLAPGKYYNKLIGGPDTCPAGFSCAGGNSVPMACKTKGTYSLAGADECVFVKPGKTFVSSTSEPRDCPVGFSCAGKGAIPVVCKAGTYALGGAIACSVVKPGLLFVNNASEPTNCPAGYSCAGKNAVAVACKIGTYSLGGAKTCTEVTPATFFVNTSTNPSLCPAGFYCLGKAFAPKACVGLTYATGFDSKCNTLLPGQIFTSNSTYPKFCTQGFTPSADRITCVAKK